MQIEYCVHCPHIRCTLFLRIGDCCGLSTGCKVRDVHLINVRPAIRHGAFVELESAEDIKLALSRTSRYIDRTCVMGT